MSDSDLEEKSENGKLSGSKSEINDFHMWL